MSATDMKIENIRNIGIMAHIDAGKTTTTERILHYAGVIHRMGEVHDGNAVMDWMDEEKKRGITITAASTSVEWKKKLINIIDTPGHVDFTVEVERSLRVLDGAVAIFCAVGGVEPQSETVWKQADHYNVPRIAFINKCDKLGASFDRVLGSMQKKLGANPLALQIPIGTGNDFSGVIDLIEMKSISFEGESGEEVVHNEIPSDLTQAAEEWRSKMIDNLSHFSDRIVEAVLSENDIPVQMLREEIRKHTLENNVFPVLCGSSLRNKGVQPLMSAIVDYLPSPIDRGDVTGLDKSGGKEVSFSPTADDPFTAIVFKIQSDQHVGRVAYFRVYSGKVEKGKTVYNPDQNKRERLNRILRMHSHKSVDLESISAGHIGVAVGLKYAKTGDTLCSEKHPVVFEKIKFPEPVVTISVEPRTAADESKLLEALNRIADEDPTFSVRNNDDTGQLIISGMGELHLEVIVNRLLTEFKVKANCGKPQVAYKETIRKTTSHHEVFESQLGGKNVFADVTIRMEPLEDNFVFANELPEGCLSQEFVSAVEQGLKDSAERGALFGYPIAGLRVVLTAGSMRETESNDAAFKIAASMAFSKCFKNARPILLEPIMKLEVVSPQDFTGAVVNDINTRRGKVLSMDPRADGNVISASVPLSEMIGYADSLRSFSQGRAFFSMEFSRYDKVSDKIFNEILSKYNIQI